MKAHEPGIVPSSGTGSRMRALLRLLPLLAPSLTVSAADAVTGPPTHFEWSAFLGPFHVVILHFPIGFIAAAACLEILGWRHPRADLRLAVRTMLWLAFGAGMLASGAGLFRAFDGGFAEDAADLHRNMAFAFLASTLAAALTAQQFAKHSGSLRLLTGYRVLLGLSLLLVGAAGHFGGNLTHGSDFLVRGAPPFVRAWIEPASLRPPMPKGSTTNQAPVLPSDPATRLYTEKVAPLFEARCYACHGPEKHKGSYRLDKRESAFRGGESGSVAISPGDPMKSNLLRLLLLPRDHDDAMPPQGKKAMSPDEILTIAHWIQAGAPFVEKPVAPPVSAKEPVANR